MALSSEFTDFYTSWMNKARPRGQADLRQAFDRFFTLYVLFNRLYAEATFRLGRRGQVQLQNRHRFPDSEAAQEYVVQYLGAASLLRALDNDPETHRALESVRGLVCNGDFSIKLNMLTGDPQPDEDRDLGRRLADPSSNTRAAAVLETLYAVRCNMFHGHKGFHPVQLDLLRPLTLVLEKIIGTLYLKLGEDGG